MFGQLFKGFSTLLANNRRPPFAYQPYQNFPDYGFPYPGYPPFGGFGGFGTGFPNFGK